MFVLLPVPVFQLKGLGTLKPTGLTIKDWGREGIKLPQILPHPSSLYFPPSPNKGWLFSPVLLLLLSCHKVTWPAEKREPAILQPIFHKNPRPTSWDTYFCTTLSRTGRFLQRAPLWFQVKRETAICTAIYRISYTLRKKILNTLSRGIVNDAHIPFQFFFYMEWKAFKTIWQYHLSKSVQTHL